MARLDGGATRAGFRTRAVLGVAYVLVPALTRLIGKYEVIGSLGEGGVGEVFLARKRNPEGREQTVVLKRLHAHRATQAAYVADFAREAQAYARLKHPTIVGMYEFFGDAGRLVLVLEYVDGPSLRALLAQLPPRGKSLGDAAALYVMLHVFSALAAAHEVRNPWTGKPAYVVHRDVKPANVLIGTDGRVKLTDFGVAKLAGVQADTQDRGLIKGTVGYMAPEQLLSKKATVRTDVYSACLLLRELLLGCRAFVRGDESEVDFLKRIAHPTLPPVETLRAGVPQGVSEALRSGLRPNPEQRDISAAQIRDVLASHVDLAGARGELLMALACARSPRPNAPSN
jgi:eukaryotic-like serine/threonine-protein kinase